jgi:hypothetical protein
MRRGIVHETAQSLYDMAARIAGGSLFPSGGMHVMVDGWLDGV